MNAIATRRRQPTNASLAEKAYQAIREMILNLELLPGQTVLIDDLAGELAMSRTPVRQALERLASVSEGLVEIVPRRGIVVTVPTAAVMTEIYQIVQGLEGQAVRIAVALADRSFTRRLCGSVDEQEAALAAADLDAWIEADRRFHQLLVDSCGNERLASLVRLFDGQLHRTRIATARTRSREALARSVAEHRAIVGALERGDREEAVRVHTAHRERALGELIERLADYNRMMVGAAAARGGPT